MKAIKLIKLAERMDERRKFSQSDKLTDYIIRTSGILDKFFAPSNEEREEISRLITEPESNILLDINGDELTKGQKVIGVDPNMILEIYDISNGDVILYSEDLNDTFTYKISEISGKLTAIPEVEEERRPNSYNL